MNMRVPIAKTEAYVRELALSAEGRKIIERVALLTADIDACVERKHVATIPVSRILAKAWHQGRLNFYLSSKEKPKPLDVSAFIILRTNWYIPSDGIHRAEAARIRGTQQITANIHSQTRCRPESFAVAEGAIWKVNGPSLRFISREPDDVLDLAVRLGARRIELQNSPPVEK